jgi:Anti-sigma factor NepR
MPNSLQYPLERERDLHRRWERLQRRTRVLAYPERSLRPADRPDLAVRLWATPMPPKVNQSVAATRGISGSTPLRDVSTRDFAEVQAAIGRYLRAEYDLAQPIPARLVDLLRQLEQRDRQSEHVAA